MRLFAKELAPILKGTYMTRGKSSISDIISNARGSGVKRVFIFTGENGNPRQVLAIDINQKNWEFINTYFITLHKLRKVITDAKENVRDVKVDSNNKAIISLLRDANIKSYIDSEFVIKDKEKAISIYKNKKEIGPRFNIEVARK